MGHILYAEALKFKRSPILWAIAAVILFPVAVSCLMAMGLEANGRKVSLLLFFAGHSTFMHFLMGLPLFTLIVGYVFSREHQEQTINALFAYPYPRWQWYLGKVLIVLPIVALVLVVSFFLHWGAGAMFTGGFVPENMKISGEQQLEQILKGLGLGILIQFALVPAGAAAGILGRSTIAPIVLGVAAVGLNGIIFLTGIPLKYAALNPWFVPMLHDGILTEPPTDDVFVRGYVTLAVAFVLSVMLGIYRFVKADIHSGS